MTIKVRCQQCGKQSQFSASDAGLTALCVACGARFTLPDAAQVRAITGDSSPTLPQPASLPPMSSLPLSASHSSTTPADALAPSDQATVASSLPQSTLASTDGVETPRSGGHSGVRYALLGAAVVIVAVAGGIFYLASRPSWETLNRTQIRQLAASARNYSANHQTQQAYDVYRQLEAFITGHELRDAQLKDEIAQARVDQDALFARLVEEAKAKPVAVVTTTKPDTASTTKPQSPVTRPAEIVESWPQYEPSPLHLQPATKPAATNPTVAKIVEPPVPEIKRPPGAANLPGRTPITVRPNRFTAGDGLTDEQIGQSIQLGVNDLLSQFRDGKLQGGANRNDAYYSGLNALCVYALLQSSYAIKDPRLNIKGPLVRQMIEKMKESPMETGPVTYARGIRATALALLARPEDKSTLQLDVNYLLNSHNNGAYTYQANNRGNRGSARMGDGPWDNSNSQYGLLGVWSGAEVGMEVNNSYWQAVENHWNNCQLEDGEWDYSGAGGRRGGGRISMTVAGIASLFVTHDYLDAPKFGSQVGRDPFSKPLAKGLEYLEQGDNSVNVGGGYALYGLERVGLASGFKFFGRHDWYRELARPIISNQRLDGSWGSQVETCYHLLFLARGRHPVLMNKLRFEGFWANRPRDVANLARFGSKELERPLNWQIVPIDRDYTDWMDSPVLYIASHTSPKFTPEQVQKIRAYVEAGGLLFTQADGGNTEGNRWALALAKQLFPAYEMADLPPEHDVYNILFKPSPRPVLRGVSNGSRLLMVHSPTDITQYWQMRQDKSRRSLFELGINLFLYSAGKGDLKNRLSSTNIPDPGPVTGGKIAVAQLKYPGNWNPEPQAWTRFSHWFARETNVNADVRTIDLETLTPPDAKAPFFAHLTGTAAYTPTERELSAMRAYVEAGGVLFIDSTGGNPDFADSMRLAVQKAFPAARMQVLPRNHPILNAGAPGMNDLATPELRAFAKSRSAGASGRLEYITSGKGKLIFTSVDLTSGLLGTSTWGIYGYETLYSCQLLKNLLLWSATSMKDD